MHLPAWAFGSIFNRWGSRQGSEPYWKGGGSRLFLHWAETEASMSSIGTTAASEQRKNGANQLAPIGTTSYSTRLGQSGALS